MAAAAACEAQVTSVVVNGMVLAAWLVASAGVTRADEPSASRADTTRLRIACFNAENLAAPGEETRLTRFRFEPGRRRHLERVAAIVETIAPDIIVMPEVVSAAGVQAVVGLLHEKGLADYEGHHVNGRDSFTGFDVAILSRIKPDLVEGRPIHFFAPPAGRNDRDGTSGEPWREQRYSFVDEGGRETSKTAVLQRHAVAYFTVGGRKIGICGVHLKSNPSENASNAQRAAETKIVREIVKRKIVAGGYLPIVLGDINDYDPDVPMADSVRTTRTTVLRDLKDYDDSSPGDELVNAARFMPRVADRYTSHWDFNENGAADRDDVFTMIDHVLVHRDLAPSISRAFISHATDLEVSDHYPVVVDFSLP
jgi:endonuclease/exonuclease/phosphatase family metal-dependent hydrolase